MLNAPTYKITIPTPLTYDQPETEYFLIQQAKLHTS